MKAMAWTQSLKSDANLPSRPVFVRGKVLQRKCACGGTPGLTGECEECRKKRLQRKASQLSTHDSHTSEVPPIVHEVVASPGQPLDLETRAFMEPRFGHDFGGVRVHTDAQAIESARAVNALAYTVGRDVVFGKGQYAPQASDGRRLLAHELTHVVQQRGATNLAGVQLTIGSEADTFEQAAERSAAQVVSGEATNHLTGIHGAAIQRQGDPAAEKEGWDLSKVVRWFQCLPGTSGDPMVNPMADISTFQSPGASGWWGAKFGCYRNNCTRQHQGWDLHAATGTEIRAISTGNITHHNDPGGYGNYIVLHTAANPQRTYLYAHLSQRQPAGDYCLGDPIGETGTTGNASANRPHLHFQVQDGGVPVDPDGYLTTPSKVIEATGSAAAVIDKTLAEPCVPC
jgi:murein DD-endopeptidase MepM/ murein hydrolase activator NlpD